MERKIRLMRFYLLFVYFAVFLFFFGCNSNKLDAVPVNFIGEWITPAERYKDLIIEITDESLLFKDPNDESPPEEYSITKIEKDDKENNLFIIFYETEGNLKYQFAFYYDESEGGILRLKNQKRFKWKKIEKEIEK